jgi:hypothetical protein
VADERRTTVGHVARVILEDGAKALVLHDRTLCMMFCVVHAENIHAVGFVRNALTARNAHTLKIPIRRRVGNVQVDFLAGTDLGPHPTGLTPLNRPG